MSVRPWLVIAGLAVCGEEPAFGFPTLPPLGLGETGGGETPSTGGLGAGGAVTLEWGRRAFAGLG